MCRDALARDDPAAAISGKSINSRQSAMMKSFPMSSLGIGRRNGTEVIGTAGL
jgi:hypothetical protein